LPVEEPDRVEEPRPFAARTARTTAAARPIHLHLGAHHVRHRPAHIRLPARQLVLRNHHHDARRERDADNVVRRDDVA